MVAGTLCDAKAALLPLSMARQILGDVNATALDAISRTTRRARLLCLSLWMALLLSQYAFVLKECPSFSLVIALLDLRVFEAMPILLDCQRCVSAPGNKLISSR